MQKYRLEWSQHLDRMEDRRLSKVAYRHRAYGKRGMKGDQEQDAETYCEDGSGGNVPTREVKKKKKTKKKK